MIRESDSRFFLLSLIPIIIVVIALILSVFVYNAGPHIPLVIGFFNLTAPLIPWNSSGVFVASVLSVNPLHYAPFAFLCILSPIVTSVFGYFRFKFDLK
ncbi:MAG: Na+/H+ antiporter NhaC family protein [Eubacteriales bacterium]